MISITPFTQKYQQQVIELIVTIQAQEFGVSITADDQPDLKEISNYYQKNAGNFWIALEGDDVVGTIALVDIGNQQGALRKMFVKQDYRGKPLLIGQQLIDNLLEFAKQNNLSEIFLGTVPNYHAAHRFYEKNGFECISTTDLPNNFQIMEVDKYFYRKVLR
jgi:N-acetylglutamate synthase-like GNAT family acetyltransferase